MISHKTHIAVVGAGIGGVALANALDRSGFRVTVLEQAETLSEIGAGLSIWENGLHALEAIGLRGSVEAASLPWSSYKIQRAGKRPVIRNNQILSVNGTVSPVMMKRGVLFGLLLEALPPSIDVFTAFKVKDVSNHLITADDGRTLSADVIIGADGAHSQVRKELTQDTPRFCNQICFRGISAYGGETPFSAAEFFDKEHHRFGYFQLPGDEVYWFDIMDSDVPFDQFENHSDAITGLGPLIAGFVNDTPFDSILCHPIEDMRPVIKVSDYIALIGDAAHPMQPSLGQGASLALEDAVVLANCLKTYSYDIPRGLKEYLLMRRRRWTLYYNMCRQMGTGALDKGLRGRHLAIARMVHTPEWSLSLFGRRVFEFKQRGTK